MHASTLHTKSFGETFLLVGEAGSGFMANSHSKSSGVLMPGLGAVLGELTWRLGIFIFHFSESV